MRLRNRTLLTSYWRRDHGYQEALFPEVEPPKVQQGS
jgi:hypothetical protein